MRINTLALFLATLGPCGANFGNKCGMLSARPSFCSGVTWNASLPLEPAALDAAAKSDFDLALDRLHKLGGSSSMPRCLESWKALQCASKFQKCSNGIPAQKVCRSLCVQFAQTCNGSESVMARCADNLLYDEPPCTDYADLVPERMTRYPANTMPLVSSPAELFSTASGLPFMLTLAVLMLHLCCCGLQSVLGSGDGEEDADDEKGAQKESPRDAIREALARGGQRGAPLVGDPSMR